MTETNTLDRVQRWMSEVITHPDGIRAGADAKQALDLIDAGSGNLESVITRSGKLSAAERLAIYGNAYYARLLECLGEVFPVLKLTLGEETFDGFGFGYLQTYPSSSYTLHNLGKHFVAYLRETKPTDSESDLPSNWTDFVIDLASLEWTIYEVFDGPGMEKREPFDFDAIVSAGGAEMTELKFEAAPCLDLLEFDFPVNDHFTLMRQETGTDEWALPLPEKRYLAVSRRDFIVRRYPLSYPQFVLLSAIKNGKNLGEALDECVTACSEEESETLFSDLPKWFKYWGQENSFITSISST